jgi:cell wall-associated NlpC family hydrolase
MSVVFIVLFLLGNNTDALAKQRPLSSHLLQQIDLALSDKTLHRNKNLPASDQSLLHDPRLKALLQPSTTRRTHSLFEAPNKKANRIINIAMKMRRVPYRWGGTTPRGFDCSGLVQYSFKHAGVSLPRTAAAQYQASRKISFAKAQRGDLLFFHMRRRGKWVNHVGIYLGNNKFIHAPRRGRVVSVEKLTNFWKKRMVGVGRVRTL